MPIFLYKNIRVGYTIWYNTGRLIRTAPHFDLALGFLNFTLFKPHTIIIFSSKCRFFSKTYNLIKNNKFQTILSNFGDFFIERHIFFLTKSHKNSLNLLDCCYKQIYKSKGFNAGIMKLNIFVSYIFILLVNQYGSSKLYTFF